VKVAIDIRRMTEFGVGTYTRAADETDMFARILDAGWLIAYTPDAYVWHRHRRTPRELRSTTVASMSRHAPPDQRRARVASN